MSETDPLKDLREHKPQAVDLSGLSERTLTDTERTALVQAAREARTNRDFLAAILGTVLKVGKAVIA